MAYRWGRIWPVLLGILIIVYGVMRMGWLSIDNDIVGIFEIVTGILILVNR